MRRALTLPQMPVAPDRVLWAATVLMLLCMPLNATGQEDKPVTLEIVDRGPVVGEELVLGSTRSQTGSAVEVEDTTMTVPPTPPVVLEPEDIAEEIAAFEMEAEEQSRKLQSDSEKAGEESWSFSASEPVVNKPNIPHKPVINKKAVPKVNVPPRRPPPKKTVTQKFADAVDTVGHEIGDVATAAAKTASRLADKLASVGASTSTREKLAETKAWVKKKVEDAKAHRERKQQTRELNRDNDEL